MNIFIDDHHNVSWVRARKEDSNDLGWRLTDTSEPRTPNSFPFPSEDETKEKEETKKEGRQKEKVADWLK